MLGGTVVLWLALMPHSKKVQVLNPGSALAFLCGVGMFSLCMFGNSPGTLVSSHRPKKHADRKSVV